MGMEKKEWTRLVKKAMAGNREAFDDIYRAKAGVILANASKLIYNSSAVDDAVQEIAVRMFGSIRKLRSPEAFNVWLYRIILNTCHTVNKQGAVYSCYSLDEMDERPEENTMDTLPAASLEQKDRNGAIARAIDGLPEKQRLTLTMYYFEEMSYREIAQILGISIDAVGMNIMKARKNLKTQLCPAGGGGNDRIPELLQGAALVPAIQQTLRAEMSRLAPPERVAAVTEKGLAAIGPHKTPAGTGAIGRSIQYLALSICALAACTIILATTLPKQQAAPMTVTAEIVMENAAPEPGEHINPTLIYIDIFSSDVQVLGWRIEDANGTAICSGDAQVIDTTELGELPPGEYQVIWLLETEGNNRTWVRRVFEIR